MHRIPSHSRYSMESMTRSTIRPLTRCARPGAAETGTDWPVRMNALLLRVPAVSACYDRYRANACYRRDRCRALRWRTVIIAGVAPRSSVVSTCLISARWRVSCERSVAAQPADGARSGSGAPIPGLLLSGTILSVITSRTVIWARRSVRQQKNQHRVRHRQRMIPLTDETMK